MKLNLPDFAVPDRVSIVKVLRPGKGESYACLKGPGCIRHIWCTVSRKEMVSRKVILRIYFDEQPVPYVEAPVGDFFGVMHGKTWYPLNTPYLSVKAESGLNCYFPMPFSRSARVEFETGEEPTTIYLMVDWHRFPGQEMTEPRRFCARWRREMPAPRYGDDYLVLDADGPGQLLGFVYGVRLLDDADRWSHGGGDNIYLDGQAEFPSYLRGIGGEDTFGVSYGGALHPPETHLYSGLPYYVHEDTGQARPAQRLVGYRFFVPDTISFRESIHLRFGCMANDICSTAYWYQEKPVRPFFQLPDWPGLLPGVELPRDRCDLPLPDTGEWWLCGPFGNQENRAMRETLPCEVEFHPEATYPGGHDPGSFWLSEGSRRLGRDVARWVRRKALRGFIDFNHVFRPWVCGPGATYPGVAVARCLLHAPATGNVSLLLGWDEQLGLRVNDGPLMDLGHHVAFRTRLVTVPLRAGENHLVVKLSNDTGSNHGGWVFSFLAQTPDGKRLLPRAS